MVVGVPKEITPDEHRVALLPVGAELLAADGRTVPVERFVSLHSGLADEAPAAALTVCGGRTTRPAVAKVFGDLASA